MAIARRRALTCRYVLVAASVVWLAGQTPPTSITTTTTQSPTFRASTKLIQVNVIVHDKKGDPVTGLTKRIISRSSIRVLLSESYSFRISALQGSPTNLLPSPPSKRYRAA
jgi:hypothetical protein